MTIQTTAMTELVGSVLGSSPIFILGTDKEPFRGGEYIIYAMEVGEEHRRICIRIPKVATGPHTSLLLDREVDLRRRIELAKIHHFQPLITSDSSVNNPLQSPYMMLGWADGRPLSWSDSSPSQKELRRNVLRSVANASLDMLRVQDTG